MVTLGGGCASSFDSQLISDPDGGGVTRSLSLCYIVGSKSSPMLNILANCVFLTTSYFPTCLQDLAAATVLRLLIVLVMFCSATLPTGSVVRWGGTVHSMHLRILSLGIIWPVTVGNAR